MTTKQSEPWDKIKVEVYSELDTSFTRCRDMIKAGKGHDREFTNELLKNDIGTIFLLKRIREHYETT